MNGVPVHVSGLTFTVTHAGAPVVLAKVYVSYKNGPVPEVPGYATGAAQELGGSARNMRVARVGSPGANAPFTTTGPPGAHVGDGDGVTGGVGLGVAQAPPVSSSTELIAAAGDPLKPSATITRPSA